MLVYQATNRINGKCYIGVTTRLLAKRRAQHHVFANRGSRSPFHQAIRKYGKENFAWEIIEEHDTEESLMAAEIRLIAERSPEYNISKGGRGPTGFRHTEATRAKLRDLGFAGKAIFAKYAVMGPAAMSRAVICLDDGKEYCSISEAARSYGVNKDALAELCNGKRNRQKVGGLRFAFADGTTPAPGKIIRCKLTAEQIEVIRVAREYGAGVRQIAWTYSVSPYTIYDALSGRTWSHVNVSS
jgi:predicted GIY-YIG superfamily endonuclease